MACSPSCSGSDCFGPHVPDVPEWICTCTNSSDAPRYKLRSLFYFGPHNAIPLFHLSQLFGPSEYCLHWMNKKAERKMDHLICSICLEHYNLKSKPVLLSCGHTFCASCLSSLSHESRIKCPLCRILPTVPFKGLPLNYSLLPLLEPRTGKDDPSANANHHPDTVSVDARRHSSPSLSASDPDPDPPPFSWTAWISSQFTSERMNDLMNTSVEVLPQLFDLYHSYSRASGETNENKSKS